MGDLTSVILPVFLIVGLGYLARWRGIITDAGVGGLMTFTQSFAIPMLLFRAISNLDLSANFELPLLLSFYGGAISGFAIGLLGARYIFGRNWEDAVAIGFVGLFSNSVLLGLPITELAYSHDALQGNFAIISIHAPFCYGVGITAMEIVRSKGAAPFSLPLKVLKAMFSNALVIGIAFGFIVNLSGTTLPAALTDAVDLMTRAALPAALFGLGGVLFLYRPEGDMRTILFICAVSLFLHPAISWTLGSYFDLSKENFRSVVLTASMAPGINTYLFAHMYNRAKRVAASTVLIGTAATILTGTFWLTVLP